MGIFSFFKKADEREKISKLNENLQNSFSNVKKDITVMHKHLTHHKDHTDKRFQQLEEKIKRIEYLMKVYSQQPQQKQTIKSEVQEELEELPKEDIANVLKAIPMAELKLFTTLHELQENLNAKHISYKSLAKYLYPEKDYNSIRSTITQFVLRLYTEGLVEKTRIGKETYVKITPSGQRIIKSVKSKKLLQEAKN